MSVVYSTAGRAATTYYKPLGYVPQPNARPNVTDDYERWYTEATPNNRMLLSLRSGIDSEVGWALDRLCRLCDNEQFLLRAIPGLTEALFEWPEWYARTGYKAASEMDLIFSPSPFQERRKRHALESLFILRNAALNEPNASELANHSRTRPLILTILRNLEYDLDENAEFLLHACELLQAVASTFVFRPNASEPPEPLPTLQNILSQSSNRSLIISALTPLTTIFSNPSNTIHLTADSPVLAASVRYLPLVADKILLDACLNYLYTHLSTPAMAKAFLLQPEMPSTLRLLVSLLLFEQVEETVTLDVGGSLLTAPALTPSTRDHELTQDELETLLEKDEPQRCYEWMKAMFIAKTEGELTQVDFWNLYKDAFSPYQEEHPLLVASDVIKNVTVVFPQAQAMVLPGPPQRFVVRGVDRRKDDVVVERFKCLWNRSQCLQDAFEHPGELFEHILEHVSNSEESQLPCFWSSCQTPPLPKSSLRAHILTHLSTTQTPAKPASQSDTITLPSEMPQYPISDPTQRPPPLPRHTTITYRRPIVDPPSNSLTSLLCIRILFRASFASSDVAPRADADHFGFPGIVEDTGDQEGEDDGDGIAMDSEKEGERRGRKAFLGVRHLLKGVRIKDETLMGWVTEMVDAGFSGGHSPRQISPYERPDVFWSNLLLADIDHEFLVNRLNGLSKDDCLENYKLLFNDLFLACLTHARTGSHGDRRKTQAVEILTILTRCLLAKNLTGWEVMEVFAGGVSMSDKFFMEFTAMIDEAMGDVTAPSAFRHKMLQLAITFMCGVGQLSPGAYFLRRDLFPSITVFVRSPDTEQFTFEAVLLLAILAEFHKSDAAKLNPYLQRIRETQDTQLMGTICWAFNFALDAAVKAYQEIWDDSVPTLTATLGSMIASLRPDRALALKPTHPSGEAFKAQPIEASVVLLPVFEFIRTNDTFVSKFLEYLTTDQDEKNKGGRLSPPPFTLLTLSSYLLTHATSASSPRSIAYADLCLKLMLAMVENDEVMTILCQPTKMNIRLCRQRLPLLPIPPSPWPLICALLDCCVLWLRHNLHKRLEAASYTTCIWICHRVIWFIQKARIRLDYHWKELWNAVVGLLAFLSSRLDSLATTGGVERLARETISMLDLAVCKSESFLPTAESIHELVYELVRSSSILKQQTTLLRTLSTSHATPGRRSSWTETREPLSQLLSVTEFYEEKIGKAGSASARDGMQIISREIDTQGLFAPKDAAEPEAPSKRGADVLGFARFACTDGLSLMP